MAAVISTRTRPQKTHSRDARLVENVHCEHLRSALDAEVDNLQGVEWARQVRNVGGWNIH